MDSEQSYYHNSPSKSLRTQHDVAPGCRTELPTDLLGLIADRLGIIDLLHFRCVCKIWYSASSSSSAQIQCFRKPWLLLYGETSQCTLFTDSAKIYNLNVPELEYGATCIASEKGWLLVIKNGSIYFFCPFSGAKLVLPELPIKDHWNYLAAFSSPPTSPDCKVCFFRQVRSSDGNELYVLVRGATSWTKDVLNSMRKTDFQTIRAASFAGDEIYLMDENDRLIRFNIKKKDVEVFQTVEREPGCLSMPFQTTSSYIFVNMNMPQLGIRGTFFLTTCGTRLVSQKQMDLDVISKIINGFQFQDDEVQSIFRDLKGVWIHPRFFRVSPSYHW